VKRFKNHLITVERLEAALAIVARAIIADGAVYAPIFDRLEQEIAALRANDDAVSRAHRYLAAMPQPNADNDDAARWYSR
jgi:hypothetical protein